MLAMLADIMKIRSPALGMNYYNAFSHPLFFVCVIKWQVTCSKIECLVVILTQSIFANSLCVWKDNVRRIVDFIAEISNIM